MRTKAAILSTLLAAVPVVAAPYAPPQPPRTPPEGPNTPQRDPRDPRGPTDRTGTDRGDRGDRNADHEAKKPAAAEEPPKEFPSLKPVLADRTSKLEKELATRLMHRPETPAAQMPQAEFQIDLRVLQDWFLSHAAAAKPESEDQIAALLRSLELADATTLIEDPQKPATPATPTRTQADAMGRLHKLTFDLGEPKDVAQLDDVARRVAVELEQIVNATPVDVRAVSPARPSRLAIDNDQAAKPPKDEATRSIAELSAEITRAAVSIPLRQQLLAIAKAAGAAEQGQQEKEATSLRAALIEGVDLARGLSSTTAFTPEAKADIQDQLAEGLALVSDPRTRQAGRNRIQELNEYRLVMNRIARTTLPPDVRASLAPAFAYAQTHAQQGMRVLNTIEDFAGTVARFDALPKRDNPVPQLRAATADVAKQYAAARQAFITAANDLGNLSDAAPASSSSTSSAGAGATGAKPTTAATTKPASPANIAADALDAQLADLKSIGELYAMLDGMKETYDTLNAYKPRPFGAIEARAQKAATAAAASVRSPTRTEGIRFLTDLNKLARLSESASGKSLADVPPAVLQNYAGVTVAEFSGKCKLLMGELLNSVAAGQEIDKKKVDRLNAVGELVAALRQAAAFERNLESVPTLQRWVDWTLSVDELRALAATYQDLLTSAFGGFMTDSPDAIDRFFKQRVVYTPIMMFLARDVEYADACSAMPEGLAGDLAQLLTPMDKQPFATERYVSYAVTVWTLLSPTDPDTAQIAADFAAKRLAREFKVRPPELLTPVENSKPLIPPKTNNKAT